MRSVATYDLGVARELGIPVDYVNEQGEHPYRPPIYDMGTHYNQHWGYLRRDRYNENAPEEKLAERTNRSQTTVYHKGFLDTDNINFRFRYPLPFSWNRRRQGLEHG